MQSATHLAHIKANVSHSNCSECRADCERRFVPSAPWPGYQFVSEYVRYIKPRLQACDFDNSIEAKQWHREFTQALQRRITLRAPIAGRKQSHSYLERLKQFGRNVDAGYLRRFAQRGASCLDA
jgi:hypothetical protein